MKKVPLLNLVLFLTTIITTLYAGAVQQVNNPDLVKAFLYVLKHPLELYKGIPFSLTLILILLSHELSHFFLSRKHHTVATLPFFIPAPTLIGTFGAVIKMKSPILSRSALIDIGASGPIVGFIFSLIASVIGLKMSHVIKAVPAGSEFALGTSLLFYLLAKVLMPLTSQGFIDLHPVAFAGWIGLLVTSLNLIPVGQLDGGHIAFAFLGTKHKYLSMFLVGVLILMGFFYMGWWVWAGILLIIGVKHPPVYHWEVPLDPRRKLLGALALIIFLLTFTPFPFQAPQ